MFHARFAGVLRRSRAISTRLSIVCFWLPAVRVKTNENWIGNIVKISLVIRNCTIEHCQTCAKQAHATDRDVTIYMRSHLRKTRGTNLVIPDLLFLILVVLMIEEPHLMF